MYDQFGFETPGAGDAGAAMRDVHFDFGVDFGGGGAVRGPSFGSV